ncbi:MAG: hypothetical protein AAFN77_19415 [Planctomycetota bacterium]
MQTTNENTPYQEILSWSANDILNKILFPANPTENTERWEETTRQQELRQSIFGIFSKLSFPMNLRLSMPSYDRSISDSTFFEDTLFLNQEWVGNLLSQMKHDSIGTYDFLGEREIVYTFYEDEGDDDDDFDLGEFFESKKKRVKHTHTVVDADIRQLPCDGIQLNPKAKWMISEIMKVKKLRKYFGMITGVLIETEEQITKRWTEETELRNALKVIRKAVGYQVEETQRDLERRNKQAKKEESIRRFMKKADPAIIFGDLVFYGWK